MHKRVLNESFSERIVRLALSIPSGKVTTYGRLARAAGSGGMAAQSVTGVLARAWERGEKSIPFHRIVYASGHAWFDDRYRNERMILYKKEGITIDANGRIQDFIDILHEFR